jgi:uncharacterized protein YkwD
MNVRLRALFVALCATSVLLPISGAHAALPSAKTKRCVGADTMPAGTNLPRIRRATLCLINVERKARGRRALRFNRSLAKAANGYAGQMVAKQFFDHVSPTGSTLVSRIEKTPYLKNVAKWTVGENLAWGSGDLATPRQTVLAWMHSPGHKRNILEKRFREAGIGVSLGVPEPGVGPGATYATEFGSRA